eukprot:1035781-Pyramimonas_sp.AAC.1
MKKANYDMDWQTLRDNYWTKDQKLKYSIPFPRSKLSGSTTTNKTNTYANLEKERINNRQHAPSPQSRAQGAQDVPLNTCNQE